MSFRAQQMYKKIVRKVGEEWMSPYMKKTLKRNLPNNKIVMGRALRGIFASRHIQFGNQISEDGGNKTRRSWEPNVQNKRLFSYVHNCFVRVKVTAHALRCIDKAGGIDEYLLKTPYRKLDNMLGVLWKAKISKKYEELEASGDGILSLIDNRRQQQQTQGPSEAEEANGKKAKDDDPVDAPHNYQVSSEAPTKS